MKHPKDWARTSSKESPYSEEELDPEDDDGTMPNNVKDLENAIIGRRIVKAEKAKLPDSPDYVRHNTGLRLTLDDGRQVYVVDTDDCCAYTTLNNFLLNPEKVDHVILGVGTTGNYTRWHIYADLGDVLELDVSWSPGNPFYYGYGFDITVIDPEFIPTTDDEVQEALRSIFNRPNGGS